MVVLTTLASVVAVTGGTVAFLRWAHYWGHPLHIKHDESCIQWYPSTQPEWQQVRLKVTVKRRLVSIHDVRLRLMEASYADLNVDADMKLTHDNEPGRPNLHGGVVCTRSRPASFDVAVHRPDMSSVIEYSDESLRSMGTIPSSLYPGTVRLVFAADGHPPTNERPVKSTVRAFVLEIEATGRLALRVAEKDDHGMIGPPLHPCTPLSAASASAHVGSLHTLEPAGASAVPPATLAPAERLDLRVLRQPR